MKPFLILGGLAAAGLAFALSSKDANASAQHSSGQPAKPKPKPRPQTMPGSGIPGTAPSTGQKPGMPPADVLARMAAALQSRDAGKIRAEAARLRKEGWLMQAAELEKAADLAAQVAHIPIIPPSPAPGPVSPVPLPPFVPPVSIPTGPVTSSPGIMPRPPAPSIPTDNRALAVKLARSLTGKKKGKEDKALVTAFQQAEGIEPDGKYGLETAQALAKYDLVPPVPLYWGKGGTYASMQNEQKQWKAWCASKAAKDPSRSAEWTGASRIPAKQ
jgi:hypothetical protein